MRGEKSTQQSLLWQVAFYTGAEHPCVKSAIHKTVLGGVETVSQTFDVSPETSQLIFIIGYFYWNYARFQISVGACFFDINDLYAQ